MKQGAHLVRSAGIAGLLVLIAGAAAAQDFPAFMTGEWRGKGFYLPEPDGARERIVCRLKAVSPSLGELDLAGRCGSVSGTARFSISYSRASATARAASPAMQEAYTYDAREMGARLLLDSQGSVPWGEGRHQSHVVVAPAGDDRVTFMETLTRPDGVERTTLSVTYERRKNVD